MATSSKMGFSSLPTELLQEIFDRLDAPDLVAVASTCRKMAATVVPKLYKHVELHSIYDQLSFSNLTACFHPERAEMVKSLLMHRHFHEAFFVTTLSINGHHSHQTVTSYTMYQEMNIALRLPNLQVLRFHVPHPMNTQHSYNFAAAGQPMRDYLQQHSTIKKLDIFVQEECADYWTVSAAQPASVLFFHPKTQHIVLRLFTGDKDGFGDPTGIFTGPVLPMNKLELYDCEVSPYQLKLFLRRRPVQELFYLKRTWSSVAARQYFPDEYLMAFMETRQCLKKLYFYRLGDHTQPEGWNFSGFPHLTHLGIHPSFLLQMESVAPPLLKVLDTTWIVDFPFSQLIWQQIVKLIHSKPCYVPTLETLILPYREGTLYVQWVLEQLFLLGRAMSIHVVWHDLAWFRENDINIVRDEFRPKGFKTFAEICEAPGYED